MEEGKQPELLDAEGNPIEPQLPDQCCGKCWYSVMGKQTMFCRRYPPSPASDSEGGVASIYPPVVPVWWCGEFVGRERH